MNTVKNIPFQISENRAAAYQTALAVFVKSMQSAMRDRGVFRVALSGGSTPGPLYEMLAEERAVPWDKVELYMVDERFVPFDHPDSNYRMIKEMLIDRIDIPESQVFPMPVDRLVDDCARMYEQTLRNNFNISDDDFPRLDLMINGVGGDGHTASLFPDNPALQEKRRWVITAQQPGVPHQRLSLTIPVLHHARLQLFLALGENKAERMKNILTDHDSRYPAFVAAQGAGDSLFIIDRDAGQKVR